MWKTEEDVLNTLDEVSVFTKDQESVRRLRIKSSKSKHRKELQDSKIKEEYIGKLEDRERTGDSYKNMSDYSLLDVNSMPISVGRASQISHYKQIKQSLSKENYIHREVQKATGCYSNDMIERNWRASVTLNRILDPETGSEDTDQFDDAENTDESSSVVSSFVSTNDKSDSKESLNELSSTESKETCNRIEESGEACDIVSRVRPATDIRETKPAKQRNALLFSLQRKMKENEMTLKTDNKHSISENGNIVETVKKDTIVENSSVVGTDKKDTTVETDSKDTGGRKSTTVETDSKDTSDEKSTTVETVKKDSTCENNAVLEENQQDSTKSTLNSEGCENCSIRSRLSSPSRIREFKPSRYRLSSPSRIVEFKPNRNRLSSPSRIVEFKPKLNVALANIPVTNDLDTDVEYSPDFVEPYVEYVEPYFDTSEECDTNGEHYQNMAVLYYPDTGEVQYPDTNDEDYASLVTEHNPDTGAVNYTDTGVECYTNTDVVQYTNTGIEYYCNTDVESYSDTGMQYCPDSGVTYYGNYSVSNEERNPVHLTWYAPVCNFDADPIFAPTTEKLVTDYKYRGDEFPPLK